MNINITKIKILHIITLFLSFFVSFHVNAQVGVEWAQNYVELAGGRARSLAVDNIGNVFVTGYSEVSNGDYLTIKYNSSGVVQWSKRYNGPGNGPDLAFSLALDLTGNVYVTGESSGNGTNFDIATIKYNSDGIEQWTRRYNTEINSYDGGRSIAIDNSGNVYIFGYCSDSIVIGSLADFDYVTIKYNSAGVLQWIKRYEGIVNGYEDPRSMVIDGSGNVYVTGGSQGNGTYLDYLTIKYNTNGDEQWMQRYNQYQNSNERVRSIVLDNTGNVYITGGSKRDGTEVDFDYITIKYNSAGLTQWIKKYQGPKTGGWDEPSSIGVDAAGNVFVTGTSESTGTNPDFATVKYNSAGIEQWVKRYNGLLDDNWDVSNSLTVDSLGSVYVAGQSRGTIDNDYAVVKYNSAGVEQWVNRFDMPGIYNQEPYAIKMDNSGNVYVTGERTTVKYNQFLVRTILLLPLNEAVNQPLSFSFDWLDTPGSMTYQLQVSSDTNFNSTLLDQSGITASVFTVGTGTLSYLSNYYWRVRAYNGIETGLWSEVWSFTTQENPPPPNGVPYLISPLNGSDNMPVSLVLDWSDIQGAFVTYDVQVSTNHHFTANVVDKTGLKISQYSIYSTIHNPILIANTHYFWRARAKSAAGTSEWSEMWSFYTGSGTSAPSGLTQFGTEIPNEYQLYNNYPNPFNPSTTIKFDIPIEGNAKIAIYDILGRETASMLNEELSPGSYSINFDATNLPSGIYFYRFTSGDYSEIKKMILIK